jgi:hypothetical protein
MLNRQYTNIQRFSSITDKTLTTITDVIDLQELIKQNHLYDA